MLIPSIDLQGGRIVQLVQGETLALESSDIDGWISRFRGSEKIQLIDLDAAKNQGSNDALIKRICAELPCRVGGGIRSVARAGELLAAGATHVIVGSALFEDGKVQGSLARALADAVGSGQLIAAVDSRGGYITINGWRTTLSLTTDAAIRELEPWFEEFLYTQVDREGMMMGTNMDAIRSVNAVTARRVTAAGGITTWDQIDELHSIGVDAVVGMAIYTGVLSQRLSRPSIDGRRAAD